MVLSLFALICKTGTSLFIASCTPGLILVCSKLQGWSYPCLHQIVSLALSLPFSTYRTVLILVPKCQAGLILEDAELLDLSYPCLSQVADLVFSLSVLNSKPGLILVYPDFQAWSYPCLT